MARWLRATPFCRPVVPDECWISATAFLQTRRPGRVLDQCYGICVSGASFKLAALWNRDGVNDIRVGYVAQGQLVELGGNPSVEHEVIRLYMPQHPDKGIGVLARIHPWRRRRQHGRDVA